MKTKLLIFAVGLVFWSCSGDSVEQGGVKEIPSDGRIASIIRNPVSAQDTDTTDAAVLTFETTEHHFGEIDEGGIVKHTFKFQNTGKAPLLITQARSTCGCTIPEWPKEPIEPGKGGEILVKFDTAGKKDFQSKPVTITANTFPAQTVVTLKGRVNNKK